MTSEGVYRVLLDYPRMERSGETTQTPDGTIKWNRVSSWGHRGYANSMEEAKEKFGGYPVLELVGSVH